ncbi:hypothetical protein IM40_05590 [Candidatus Paracaedimonas acanthamoebae]|nr:hypothetical protein IM40_05590 [Candidatus Paracaedimonas acanthamoebae]
MKIFNRCSTFSAFIFTGILILVTLGNWQIYRLHWKQDLISKIQKRSQILPIPIQTLETLPTNKIKNFEFSPTIAEGRYLHTLEFKLLGRTHQGQAGYHMITPLLLKTKKILLVDRGWVPFYEKSIDRPRGLIKIKGLIRLNSEKNFFTPENDFSSRELYFIAPHEITIRMGIKELLPFYICISDTIQPSTFPISIPLNLKLRNFHLAYALTWYSLALGLGILYFFFKRKK